MESSRWQLATSWKQQTMGCPQADECCWILEQAAFLTTQRSAVTSMLVAHCLLSPPTNTSLHDPFLPSTVLWLKPVPDPPEKTNFYGILFSLWHVYVYSGRHLDFKIVGRSTRFQIGKRNKTYEHFWAQPSDTKMLSHGLVISTSGSHSSTLPSSSPLPSATTPGFRVRVLSFLFVVLILWRAAFWPFFSQVKSCFSALPFWVNMSWE